jgi:hypothetical protein
VTVALGSFVDPEFPMPTTEFLTKFRHPWVLPVAGAIQLYDPLDGSVPLETMLATTEDFAAE